MKATQKLHELGQSVWLDNITRDLLTSGTLRRYIADLSLTGLTSNPTIFDHAIKNSSHYDAAIRRKLTEGKSGETLFFELAIEDLAQAADLFRPIWDRTNGVDGWVSLEVSPLLAHDTASTIAGAKELHAQAKRPNLFIKIPGTREGLPAIEESIFAGVPVNATLLFSREHYLAAAEAYLRGIERRIAAGLNPNVGSVASVFVSRWDAAVANEVPAQLRNQLGIAIAKRTYKAACELLSSARSRRIYNEGGRPQRRLWASTGTKDPAASDVPYVKALAAPLTVNTMPESTVKALADHGEIGEMLLADGGESEPVLSQFAKAGVEIDALAATLQDEGANSFIKSWNAAMFAGEKINVSEKRAVLHVALRAPKGQSILVDGEDVVPQVHTVLDRMADFSNRVRGGAWRGYTGKAIRNIVNIGIGGSDLGPVMAYEALKHYSDRAIKFRFVSNVDGTDFAEAIRDLDPAETLFVHRYRLGCWVRATIFIAEDARTAVAARKLRSRRPQEEFRDGTANSTSSQSTPSAHCQSMRFSGKVRAPGTSIALAPLIYTLWNRVMRFDPQDPIWPNRDRFVLSNGHACRCFTSLDARSECGIRTPWAPRSFARRYSPLPPAGQQGSRTSRVPSGFRS